MQKNGRLIPTAKRNKRNKTAMKLKQIHNIYALFYQFIAAFIEEINDV